MDRIDLKVGMENVTPGTKPSGESSETIRKRVVAARAMQLERLKGTPYACNADVPGTEIRRLFSISADGLAELARIAQKYDLSMRGHDRLAKVARTVADLAGSLIVSPQHVAEAGEFV